MKLPKVLTGEGAPADTLKGDFYRDIITYDFYDKIDDVWVKREKLKYNII